MKLFCLPVVLMILCFSLQAQNQKYPYKDKNLPIEKRIDNLLKLMTLEEKILQLNQSTAGMNTNVNNMEEHARQIRPEIGSLIFFSSDPAFRNQLQKKAMEESRLGIPILFGFDVIHGFRTIFPIPLAQACSWNPALVKDASAVAAKEASIAGVNWTFSPMIDIARDPRWGRVSEGYGEDPYTASVFGVAAVQGYQGTNLADPYTVAACLKHYIGYGMSEGGRDYHYTDISMQSLWETYMVPYEAGVKAGAATLMSSFNDLSGVPTTVNRYLLTEVLKEQWKHDGFIVSDWESIHQLINQGVAKDRKEAAYKSIMAGVEMDMVDNVYLEHLKQLVEEKKVPMTRIDDAVRRVLRLKFRLGLFDNPYTTLVDESQRFLQDNSRKVAEKLAEESMVLLKNTNGILPLSQTIKNIAVIGPMARNQEDILGSWEGQGQPKDAQTILGALEKEFSGKATLHFAHGSAFDGNDTGGFADAVSVAQKSDVIVLCIGEKKGWSGENASRSTIALPAIQEKLLEELKKTGKPVIIVLANGRPVELQRIEPLADAILEMWQPGTEGGMPVAGILSGRINPSGKLSITFPLTTGQIPVYYNMRQAARPNSGKYQDVTTKPLYWFGHGLSYTTYQYGEVKVSKTTLRKTEKLTAEVEVTNTGSRDGKETVLWFISDPFGSISRPMKELKFFEKKEIKKGEKVIYRFQIDPLRDLGYVDGTGKKFIEAGDFYIIVNDQKVKIQVTE